MRALLCFFVGCGVAAAITYACLRETRFVRRGWFELDGQPVRLDGIPVADWLEVNNDLARPADDLEAKMTAYHERTRRSGKWEREILDRVFVLEYRPVESADVLRRVVVQRFYLSEIAGGGQEHPSGYARHEIVETTDSDAR
ncbi:MAG: hypothetical protein KDC95_01235 [Planctomycetes bacterium]|nr:hypothetical protein [Planctomycetota bacterium]